MNIEDAESTIAFLEHECSEELFIWLGEIADDISKSSESIEALWELCKKYPEVSGKYNIPYFSDSVAKYL